MRCGAAKRHKSSEARGAPELDQRGLGHFEHPLEHLSEAIDVLLGTVRIATLDPREQTVVQEREHQTDAEAQPCGQDKTRKRSDNIVTTIQ